AASGGGEEEASGRDGVAGQAPAAPGGAERKSGEAAGEAPEERAALLEQHAALAGERERLRQDSAELQQAERRAGGPQLYDQCLLRLQDLREQQERVAARRRGGEERQAQAQAEWAALQARKKEVAVSCLGRRLGSRRAAAKAVDGIQARERDTERQVYEVRMEKIKLKHEIQNLETILKAQGELVESQHFIDFEHKKNQKHSGNLDDLSDEILKLKKKVSNTVHIISQFREKIQFVQAENQGRKAELMDSETVLSQKRCILTGTRQARARLRKNNLKLQQKCGLLGNEMLLQDFEEKVNTVELLSQRLETLKCHHAGLLLTRRELRKKIKEANSLLA
ncbi:CCD96 protein, partial [Steatornis caripensis]|nr:CCD96 protein [Steatornis caripensis]